MPWAGHAQESVCLILISQNTKEMCCDGDAVRVGSSCVRSSGGETVRGEV